MAQLNVYKVTSLPETPVSNAIYLVKGASDTEVTMFVTDNAGTARPLSSAPTELRTAGDTGIGAIKYSGTTMESGQLYGGDTSPVSTTRLNYDGNFHARNFLVPNDSIIGTGSANSNTYIQFASNTSIIVNVPESQTYTFRRGGATLISFSGLGITADLGGLRTSAPTGFGNAFWRLGNAASGVNTSFSHSIRVQVGTQVYSIPATLE